MDVEMITAACANGQHHDCVAHRISDTLCDCDCHDEDELELTPGELIAEHTGNVHYMDTPKMEPVEDPETLAKAAAVMERIRQEEALAAAKRRHPAAGAQDAT